MTTTRERLGLATGALIAILVFMLIAAYGPRPAVVPEEIGRAGLPPSAADTEPALDANE